MRCLTRSAIKLGLGLSSWPSTDETIARGQSIGWQRWIPLAALAASILLLTGFSATWWQATRVAQMKQSTVEQTVKAGCAQLVQAVDAEWE